ncbi:MAG TPA: ATP synthase F1 subunit epsilon [Anaerolineae bacterium]|nr:ATP synthase F1 subunit epsilon [Caldilineae bacterium]HID34979.1 ATP synthase F1 subunit epsilon [Anaerolineae bacterium]
MAKTHFSLIAQDRIVYEDDVDMVILPGSSGVFAAMAKHAPLMSTLQPGEILVRKEGEDDRYFSVGGGFAEVRPDEVIVLARSAEAAEEIDIQRAEEAMRRAQEYLRSPEKDRDVERRLAMEAALRRSLARMKVARKRAAVRARGADRGPLPPQQQEEQG